MRPSFDDMKNEALETLENRWGLAVVCFGIVALIPLLSGTVKYLSLIHFLIAGAMNLGLSYFFLRTVRKQEVSFNDIFSGFNQYGKSLLVNILMLSITSLFIVLLSTPVIIWSVANNQNPFEFLENPNVASLLEHMTFYVSFTIYLLILVVALVVVQLSLSQTYNIINDNPNMSVPDAFRKSFELMKDNRTDYFLFNLSFIGWALLSILTLGLGFLVLGPYVSASNAVYYKYLLAKDAKETPESQSANSTFDEEFNHLTASYRKPA